MKSSRRAFLSGASLGFVAPAFASPGGGTAASVSGRPQGNAPASDGGPSVFTAVGQGAVPLTVQDRLRQTVSAKDYGAVADGFHHPLSERFSSLAAARAHYPFARSLDQTLDWAGLQAALDAVEERRGRVHLSAGRYRISDTIELPNFVELVGDGPGVSVIDNQNTILRAPQIVNRDRRSFVNSSLRHLSLHGGTHGLKIEVSGEVAGLMFDHVVFGLQTDKNLECNRLLQTTEFHRCVFADAPYGVYVGSWTTNAVNFYNCSFENHARSHVRLQSAEAVNFYGGRFEGGGHGAGSGEMPATLDLQDAGAINFYGVYFEATHELLLRERRSRSGVAFHGCHFTGAVSSEDAVAYRFDSDGIVEFGSNEWGRPSAGAARMLITGNNGDKLGSDRATLYFARDRRRQLLVSPVTAVPRDGRRQLVAIRLQPGREPDLLMASGSLIVDAALVDRGGRRQLISRYFHLRCSSANGQAAARAAMVSQCDEQPADALTITGRWVGGDQPHLLIEALFSASLVADVADSSLQWSFEHMTMIGADDSHFSVDLA